MSQDEDDLRLCATTKMFSSYVGGYGYGIEYTSMCCHKTYLANFPYIFFQNCFTKQSLSSENMSTKQHRTSLNE